MFSKLRVSGLALGVILTFALVGCGTSESGTNNTATVSSTSTSAGMGATTPAGAGETPSAMETGTPAMEGTPTAGDPAQIVRDFLSTAQAGNGESEGMKYLSNRLRSEDKTAMGILGVQNQLRSFTVGDTSVTDGMTKATVRAVLDSDGGPDQRVFTLIMENGVWVIDSVTEPRVGGKAAPGTPQEVVNAFLAAYQNGATAELDQYMSELRRQSMTPGGPMALLNIQGPIESFTTTEASTSANNATVTATIIVNGAEQRRVFTLINQNNDWRIDAIDAPRE